MNRLRKLYQSMNEVSFSAGMITGALIVTGMVVLLKTFVA